MYYLKAFIFIFTISNVFGSEVDHYSTLDKSLKDSTTELNRFVNKSIKDIVDELNKKGSCTEDMRISIADELVSRFQGLGWRAFPRIETDIADELKDNQKISLTQSESIYKNFGFSEGFAAGLGLACCSDLVKVNNVRVGTDKLGHFFLEGYYFYLESLKKQKSHLGRLERSFLSQRARIEDNTYAELKIHTINKMSEENLFGYYMTGVYSYADKIANYEGTKFWKEFFSKSSRFIECNQGKNIIKSKFDWKNYVNPMWDESINCNKYVDKDSTLEVESQILDSDYGSCPRRTDLCEVGRKKYGKQASFLIHPKCFKN